jgi:c-di-GMP-binding flagellar brake protein YcgR
MSLSTDTKPFSPEALNEPPRDDAKDEPSMDSYRLVHPLDICSVLADLRRGRNPLTIRWGVGAQQAVTSVIHVDNAKQEWMFEPDKTPGITESLLSAKAVAFSGSASGIRVRFVTPPPVQRNVDGQRVLVAPLPQSLIRLQMRRHFRAVAKKTNPYGCVSVMSDGQERSLYLHDISLGGVGLRARDIRMEDLPIGTVLNDALLSFGELGSLQIGLRVMSQRVVDMSVGNVSHFGCQFIDPGRSDEPFVQRVIYHLELLRRNGA